MFKHRLSKFSWASLLAVCLLFVGGSLQSCKDMLDEYKYDDSEPEWLGASIYAFLKEGTEGHSYANYIELIDSLGEKETLNHTGSKTLFVADDEAFARFYANNPWGVKSVADMTKAQMKILLYNSMLDNALLLDMMSSTSSNLADQGKCLRRTTSFDVCDTVALVDGSSFKHHENWPTYNKYWDILRGKERAEKMRIAMDGSQPMMVHFLGEYLKKNGLQTEDIEFLFKKADGAGKEYEEGDAFIFGNKLVPGGVDAGEYSDDSLTITCKNGYIYRMDGVLLPPKDMASELRDGENTRIFSHMIDRFCVPVYNSSLTTEFRSRYEGAQDSVFSLRYFSKKEFTSEAKLAEKKLGPTSEDEMLNYDPGKCEYERGNGGKLEDMAAMLVPTDQYLYDYFANPDADGYVILEEFAKDITVAENYSPENVPVLLQALDSVPQVIIASFVNNLMKSSFKKTVPSRFRLVVNDAMDEMGLETSHIDSCIIANNGVIYLMNKVFSPAKFAAVSAPTEFYENLSIMRFAIMQLRYDYYLLAMDAKYTFLIPENDHFVYYDPITFIDATSTPKMYSFHYNDQHPNGKKELSLWADVYEVGRSTLQIRKDKEGKYSPATSYGPVSLNGQNFGGYSFMRDRMADIMDYLIIVHDEKYPELRADKQYYSTKGYGTIKIDVSDPSNVRIYGGEQLETGTVVLSTDEPSRKVVKENGVSYSIFPGQPDEESRLYSSVPTPPRRSVYDNMSTFAQESGDSAIYREFFNLCKPADFQAKLEKMFPNANKDSVKLDSQRLYSIFYTGNSNGGGRIINGVPFFNTYHYTVYVPSNDAVKDLHAGGFPTWETVDSLANVAPGKAASVMRQINGLLRYHFQDNSVYYDKCKFSIPGTGGTYFEEANFATSIINNETGRFHETTVRSDENNTTIIVKDEMNEEARFVNTPGYENVTWNVMCRDIVIGSDEIATSSFSVIQPIDRVLSYKGLFGYDGKYKRFANTGELVDTLNVKGGKGGYAAEFGGEECYLVAKGGTVNVTIDAKTTEKHKVAYLMKPIDETDKRWKRALTHEAMVEKTGNPVMITTEGYLLKKTLKADGQAKVIITEFDLYKEGGKEYYKLMHNSGEGYEKVLREVAKPETGGDGASDNNSDVE